MNRIQQLIREVLSTPPSEDKCNCGCHSCENVGNKGPVLNENLGTKIIMTENMKHHVSNKTPLTENAFRYGSESFINLWAEARALYEQKAIFLNDIDKAFIRDTDLGKFGMYEGKKVPLDLILEEESEIGGPEDVEFATNVFVLPYLELLNSIEKDYGRGDAYYEIEQAIFDKNLNQIPDILRRYELDKNYSHLTRVNEAEKKKKNPPLGKPKRGGSKKFYVYVRDPKSKRIKKVSFGMAGGGLRAKLNNPKARQAFAKRHNCAQKKDKTKASYWSCRLPRYAKALGFNTTFSGYW
jgi:hypothetical protein